MKLFLNKASPYARLVQVVAHEKGLSRRIELAWTDPWASEQQLLAVTPYSKVPVLIAEDGLPLTESACICDYLDERGAGERLLPASGEPRLSVLRKVGLGRGLIDAAFGAVILTRFAAADMQSVLVERWRTSIMRAVRSLDDDSTLSLRPDLGDLTLAVALSYLEFRMSDVSWRTGAQRLSQWYERMAARPSMVATAPQ
jgi:glutathione S-transferase